MKAQVYTVYGNSDVLKYEDVVKPEPNDNEVLIKVSTTSLNSSDMELLKGTPAYTRFWGPFKPSIKILGSDIAGIVEAVGKNIVLYKKGDAVFGDIFEKWGGLAEYVCASEESLLEKPDDLSFEHAASIPQAAVVALQGLRDKGQINSRDKVLINGAGGGSGSFAIQLAKLYNAEVTGVDNEEKQEFMLSLGADHVIDYTKIDFTRISRKYDLILDFVAYRSILNYKRALHKKGRYVMVGGYVRYLLQTIVLSPWIKVLSGKKMGVLGHKQNKKDLAYIVDLIKNDKLKVMIDKHYSLEETPKAFKYLGDGHAKGKVIINIMQ